MNNFPIELAHIIQRPQEHLSQKEFQQRIIIQIPISTRNSVIQVKMNINLQTKQEQSSEWHVIQTL